MLEHPNRVKASDVEHAAEKTEAPEAPEADGMRGNGAEKGQE